MVERAEARLDGREQVLAGREVLERQRGVGSGAEPAGEEHLEAGLERAVGARPGEGDDPDVVEHRLAAVGRAAGEVDLELAGEALGDRVAEEQVGDRLGPRRDVEHLERAGAGEVAAGDVADGVAAGLAAGEADGGEEAEHFGDVPQLHEVELHVLAGGEVTPAAGVLGGDGAEHLELLGRDPAVGDLHPHHLVGAALALAVDALVQAHDPEDVLREVAREVLLDRRLELVDLVGDLGVEGPGSELVEIDGHRNTSEGSRAVPNWWRRDARRLLVRDRGEWERSWSPRPRPTCRHSSSVHLVRGASLRNARGTPWDRITGSERNDVSPPEMPVFWSGINPTGFVENPEIRQWVSGLDCLRRAGRHVSQAAETARGR